MSSLLVLFFAVLYSSVTTLHNIYVRSEHISNGKDAKQSSTHTTYVASNALNKAHAQTGSLTNKEKTSWWEVDLRGYFKINNVTVTATSHGSSYTHMTDASVEVMDKDVSLCSDAQVVWCGDVPSIVVAGGEFTFTCNATFPVRFVRVTRGATVKQHLWIGHVDVQGKGTTKPYRSYYKSSKNKKVSQPFLTTSAVTAGDCGIVCHKHHSCIDFSYSATAPTDENCLLTDKTLTTHYVSSNMWTTYTIYCM